MSMVKVNNVLTNIFFWVIVALTCVLANNWMPFVDEVTAKSGWSGFTPLAFYSIASVIFILIIFYFILEHKDNKLKLHPVYFPVLTMLTIMLVAMIWVQPAETFVNPETGFEWVVKTTVDQNTRFSILTVFGMIVVYMVMVPYSSKQVRTKQILWLAYILLAFALVSIALSFIYDFGAYKSIFQTDVEQYSVRSIWNNPNTYAYFLLHGLFALAIINYHHRNLFNYFLMIVIFVAMVFTSCSTTFAISIIFIPVYFFANILMNAKKKGLGKTLFKSLLFITVIAGLIVTMYLLQNLHIEWYMGLSKFVNEEILSKNFNTFTGRTYIWENMLKLLDGNVLYIMFGRGNYVSTEYMRGFSIALRNGDLAGVNTQSMHNGFIEILLKSGAIGLSLYIVLIVMFIVSIIYLFTKKKGRFAFTYLLIFLGSVVHAMLEQQYYFGSSFNNMMVTLLFFMPPINAMRHMVKPKNVYQVEHKDAWRYKLDVRKFTRLLASVMFASICVLAPLFVTHSIYSGDKTYLNTMLYLLAAFGIMTILVPYVVSNWYKRSKSRKTFILRIVINSILVISALTGIFYLLIDNHVSFNQWAILLIVSGVFLLDGIIYNLFTRIKFWLSFIDVLYGCFVLPKSALLYTLFLAPVLVVTITILTPMDWFYVLFLGCTNLIMYFSLLILAPTKTGKYYVDYINEQQLARIREITFKTNI